MEELLLVIVLAGIVWGVLCKPRSGHNRHPVRPRYGVDVDKGTRAEHGLVSKLLFHDVSSSCIFENLYVPAGNGTYAQIDVAVVTDVGVVVFEVKNYSGWIFGKGYQSYWTQVLAYGREKHRFYNPVLQNRTHIDVLRRQIRSCGNVPFFSVVVFYGNCTLRNVEALPEGVYVTTVSRVMLVWREILRNNPVARYDRAMVEHILEHAESNGQNKDIRYAHVERVRMKYRNKREW